MKKKLALLLSVLSVVTLLGACGSDSTKADSKYSPEELEKSAMVYATEFKDSSKEEITELLNVVEYLDKNPLENIEYGINTQYYLEAIPKWLSAMEICGNYVDVVPDSFAITKSGKTLTTDLTLKFEKRNVTFQLVYNYHNMELTGVTIEPVYSLGEKLAKAGMNTLICMSIVFVVLLFISLLISCFKIFPYLEEKKKTKASRESAQITADQPVITQNTEPAPQTDDTELVAVIAAAIAAYEGTSTSDFVVRSIRRR